jgi:Flp pilus assembly protein protease CpaA
MITTHLSEIIFLPAILVIGFFTSTHDIKSSRIPNKAIVLGILYALIFYAVFTGLNSFHGPYEHWALYKGINMVFMRYAFLWTVNLLVSALVAYALWHNDAWGAGDAKLFICYAALIPMKQYAKIYFHGYFASFYLLYVTFVLALGYILITAVIREFRAGKDGYLRRMAAHRQLKASEFFSPKNILGAFCATIGFFLIFVLMRVLRDWTQASLAHWIVNPDIMAAILLLFSRQVSQTVNKNLFSTLLVLAATIGVFRLIYLDSPATFSVIIKSMLGRSVLLALVFPVARILAAFSGRVDKHKIMPFAPWLFLGALVVWFMPH